MQILVKAIGELKGHRFADIADAVLDFAEGVAEERLRKHGENFVENWDNPPGFDSKSDIEGNNLVVSVWPARDAEAVQHWTWVSRGTKKNYAIFPTGNPKSPNYNPGGPKALTLARYLPHSSGKAARVKTEGPGTRSEPFLHSGPVMHPGIKPRHFEEAWRSWANLWWGPGIRDAIKKAAK